MPERFSEKLLNPGHFFRLKIAVFNEGYVRMNGLLAGFSASGIVRKAMQTATEARDVVAECFSPY